MRIKPEHALMTIHGTNSWWLDSSMTCGYAKLPNQSANCEISSQSLESYEVRRLEPSKLSHMLHVWNIYLHLGHVLGINIPYMEHLGMRHDIGFERT